MMSDAGNDAARDTALFIRMRQGDTAALSELARIYRLPLCALAVAWLGSDALMEDVVQDVFITLWERRETIETPDNVAAYLRRSVRNRAANVVRHESAQQRAAERAVSRDPEAVSFAENTAERALDDADLEAQVQTALAHVPPSPRRVFLLSWSGLTYEEIADIMGMTPKSVRQQMYRAMQRLVETLGDRI